MASHPLPENKRRSRSIILIWIFVAVVVFIGGFYAYFLPKPAEPISLKSLNSSSVGASGPESTNIIQDTLSSAEAEYPKLQKTFWIEQGDPDAPQKLYVVLDPNCIFCHELFQELQPLIEKKAVAVRWIVVGVIRPSSPDRAQAILTAADPLEALKFNEAHFNEAIEEGGIPAAIIVSEKATQRFEKNMSFAIQTQLNMTPVAYFFDTTGNFVRHNGGASKNQFTEMMKHVGGQF